MTKGARNFPLPVAIALSTILLAMSEHIPSNCPEWKIQKIVGGQLGSMNPPDDKIAPLIETLKPSIYDQVGVILKETLGSDADIKVHGYKEQVVAGVNYFVKLSINGQIFHAKIFHQSWTNILRLTEVKGPIIGEEEIKYF